MRILYVLNSGSPGGVEQHVFDLVKGMVNNGHKVYVWCRPGEISSWYTKAGAKVKEKGIGPDIDKNFITSLKEFLVEEEIDILHAHDLKSVANSLLAGFYAKTPVRITHSHTPISEWKVSGLLKKLITHFQIFCYAVEVNLLATVELALTESRKKVKIQEGILRHKLRVIPNGLDFGKFDLKQTTRKRHRSEIRKKYGIPSDALVIGNLGRLTEEKGNSVLIEAFADFLRFPVAGKDDFYLLLAGGGELESNLKKLAKELKIEDKVIITGVFEEKDKVKFYNCFDLFVFPSLAEGFGIVLIEAMFVGLPIICSNLPVLKEVAKDTAVYFKVEDSRDLANHISVLYKNWKTRGVDTTRQKLLVKDRYSSTSFVRNYLELYIGLLLAKK